MTVNQVVSLTSELCMRLLYKLDNQVSWMLPVAMMALTLKADLFVLGCAHAWFDLDESESSHVLLVMVVLRQLQPRVRHLLLRPVEELLEAALNSQHQLGQLLSCSRDQLLKRTNDVSLFYVR